jgi:hypothetical protein
MVFEMGILGIFLSLNPLHEPLITCSPPSINFFTKREPQTFSLLPSQGFRFQFGLYLKTCDLRPKTTQKKREYKNVNIGRKKTQ